MFGARKPLVWRSSEWMQRWLAGVAFTVLQGRRQMTLQSRSSRHGLLHQDDFPGFAGCGFNVPSLWYKWWRLWMSFKSFCWTQLASNAVRHRSLVSLMVSCSELVMIVRGSLRAWKDLVKSPAVNLRNCILLWNHWKKTPRSSRHRRACSWSWWSWSRAKQLARWAVAWTLDLFMPCSFKYLQLLVVTVIPPHMGSAKKRPQKFFKPRLCQFFCATQKTEPSAWSWNRSLCSRSRCSSNAFELFSLWFFQPIFEFCLLGSCLEPGGFAE